MLLRKTCPCSGRVWEPHQRKRVALVDSGEAGYPSPPTGRAARRSDPCRNGPASRRKKDGGAVGAPSPVVSRDTGGSGPLLAVTPFLRSGSQSVRETSDLGKTQTHRGSPVRRSRRREPGVGAGGATSVLQAARSFLEQARVGGLGSSQPPDLSAKIHATGRLRSTATRPDGGHLQPLLTLEEEGRGGGSRP